MLDFYLNRSRIARGDMVVLKQILGRLCCPEACLSFAQVLALQDSGCAPLTPENEVHLFVGRPIFCVVFLACAHRSRRSNRNSGRDPYESLESWCISAGGACALFLERPSARVEVLELSGRNCEQEACSVVLENELSYLEGARVEGIGSFSSFVKSNEENFPARLPKVKEATTTISQLEDLAPAAIAALQKTEPARQIHSEYSEEEECNDGDSYRIVNYETSIFRCGYILVDLPRFTRNPCRQYLQSVESRT